MGQVKSLKAVRRVIEDCMHNIHPIYHIKEMMIKRELAKDPELANENWERFLPNFKRKTLSRRRKPLKVRDKTEKPYTPFPPPQEPSKLDKQIESGEYFLAKAAKLRAQREEKAQKQRDRKVEKQNKREAAFVAPKEEVAEKKKKKKRKREAVEADADE